MKDHFKLMWVSLMVVLFGVMVLMLIAGTIRGEQLIRLAELEIQKIELEAIHEPLPAN